MGISAALSSESAIAAVYEELGPVVNKPRDL
jgi:hypothetical protein